MSGDLHILNSQKHLAYDIDDITRLIRKKYPGATKEGSIGAYHWMANNVVIGEAWLNRSGKGWWFRMEDKP